jgi:hypothetical protein
MLEAYEFVSRPDLEKVTFYKVYSLSNDTRHTSGETDP